MPRPLGSFTYLHPHLGWFMRPKFTARRPVGNIAMAMTAGMTAAMAVGGGVVTNAAAMVATMAGVVDGLQHMLRNALLKRGGTSGQAEGAARQQIGPSAALRR